MRTARWALALVFGLAGTAVSGLARAQGEDVYRYMGVERPEVGGRPPLTLERTKDGRYLYDKIESFRGYIDREGTLTIEEGPPVRVVLPESWTDPPVVWPYRLLDFPGIQPGSIVPSGYNPFDPSDPFSRDLSSGPVIIPTWIVVDLVSLVTGEPPNTYEQIWFAKQTQPLQDRLTDASRRRSMGEALHELPKRLERVWDNPSLPDPQKRALVFAMWDECSDEPGGKQARAIVESFVRKEFSEGSPAEFTDQELRRLNDRRMSGQPFDPYGEGPVDVTQGR